MAAAESLANTAPAGGSAAPLAGVPAALLDEVADALLWFDAQALLAGANAAARRLVEARPGTPARMLLAPLGGSIAEWFDRHRLLAQRGEALLEGDDGVVLRCAAWRLDDGGSALRLSAIGPLPATQRLASGTPAGAGSDELLRMLWAAPFPALLHDARHRIVDANEAFVSFSGHARAALIGRDLVELVPAEDRDLYVAARRALGETLHEGAVATLMARRIVDGGGAERWFRSAAYTVHIDGRRLLLEVLQDSTGEHVARAQAERTLNELSQWFDLSPAGMLVYDDAGLILRSNPAFESLVERVPVMLADAAPELQFLLGWQGGASLAEPGGGAAPLERQALVPVGEGRRRRLGARVSSFATRQGERRTMAVVEDRSAEEERDLAQLEIGALMDTASIGVATFDPSRGWLGSWPKSSGGTAGGPERGGLFGIGREMVEPDSLPEYERLQQALRHGAKAEVRYAVSHPELGQRWLLTRVEPAALGGDRSTTSVVTLDVTEQELSQRRGEQLLRELSTILDGSPAGIAYLRGTLLVRCNRRFERLLGLEPGAAAGATLQSLFARLPQAAATVVDAAAALADGRPFEAELPAGEAGGLRQWYSLSMRRAEQPRGEIEAVAVLTDISRLKAQQVELERLLRERELMFTLSDVGIVYMRGRRIERANQAMAQLTGYAAPELTALDGSELHADARECVEFETALARGLRQQGRYAAERRLRRRDGSLRWVQIAARAVDAVDPDAGVICSYVDIDERYRARASLAQQAERTRALLDSVLVGIVTVGQGDPGAPHAAAGGGAAAWGREGPGAIEWMNRSARRMFGGELADFVGESISIVATPDPDHPLRRRDWFERLTEGRAETFECRLKARDGREFWVVGNAVVTGRGPGAGQITFALLDIERRRQAEVSIAQAQASLQRMIETAPLAIALFEMPARRVLQANQTAAQFFGRPAGELPGLGAESCGAPALAAALRQWLDGVADAAEAQHHEFRAERPDGAARVWDVRLVMLETSAGVAAQALLVASDVTEQRAAEQARLQAAITQRELLVREVHHRIKNNLQGVAGLLQQHAERQPAVSAMLMEAVSQVQTIAQVYGLQVGSGGPLRVVHVLQAIGGSVQRTFGRPIVVAATDEAGARLLPEADSIPIALVLNELLTNAIKHGHGDVRCDAVLCDEGVCIAIANRGELPAGFSLQKYPGALSGLGLARALLPRRSSTLAIEQDGDDVVASVRLRPPSVVIGPGADRH